MCLYMYMYPHFQIFAGRSDSGSLESPEAVGVFSVVIV